MKSHLLFLITVLFPTWIFASGIEGTVLDAEYKIPLAFAHIQILDADYGTISDEEGRFELKGLPTGTYRLRISHISYEADTVVVELVEGKAISLSVTLTESTIQLSEIIIAANPASSEQISSLSFLDITVRPIQTSQEVLTLVPGLFIAQHAGGGKAEQMFLRGFDLDHGTDISLNVAGMPVNMVSHAHGQGYSDLHFLIPETIERVSYEKGMYDPQYGNFATAGFVDFHYKKRLDENMVKLEVGQFGTLRGVGMMNLLAKQEKHHLYAAGSFGSSRGYFESPQHFRRYNGLMHYHSEISQRGFLTASIGAFSSNWDASGQIPVRAVEQGLISRWGAIDDTEGGNTHRMHAQLKYSHKNRNGGLWEHKAFYIRSGFELYSNFTFFLDYPEVGDMIRQRENRDIWGFQSSYRLSYQLGQIKVESEWGIQGRQDKIDDLELSYAKRDEMPREYMKLGRVDETNLAAYWDQTYRFSPNFYVRTGLRLDAFRFAYQSDLNQGAKAHRWIPAALSPKISAFFTPNNRLQFYAKAGRGFHSNDSRLFFDEQINKLFPFAYGSDLGIKYKATDRLLLELTGWGLYMEEEFVYVGDAGIVEPSGRSLRMGVDISGRYQLGGSWYADLDATLTRPRQLDVTKAESFIPLAPRLTLSGGVNWILENGLSGSVRMRHLANRPANEDFSLIAEGYTLADVKLNYRLGSWELTFSVQNVLNQDWREAQFETTSRLIEEAMPTTEIHFTPGSPRFVKVGLGRYF